MALRQGEVIWRVRHFGFAHADRRADFSGACVMRETERPRATIQSELDGSAADSRRNALRQIVGGRMEKPGAVVIGGQRGAVDVVEVAEALLNRAKRTQQRVAGRPQQRWIWGAVEGGIVRVSRMMR